MEREGEHHSSVTKMQCEMVGDSSLFKSSGSHFTLAKAAYLVDRNGLEEFLPLPEVSNFLSSALSALAHYILNTRCVYLAIIWSGSQPFQEVLFDPS